MYRKIIFIAIDLFSINPFLKTTILLFISGINYELIFHFHPFVFRELNLLEYISSFCVITTVFFGAMYLCDGVGDIIKIISFLFIISINTYFLVNSFIFIWKITLKRKWERISMVSVFFFFFF